MVGADRAGRLLFLTLLTMTAFAANSILCRLALESTPIDPATFTVIRLVSGAVTLWLIVRLRTGGSAPAGSWTAAFACSPTRPRSRSPTSRSVPARAP
jgi:hypothetical protein